MKYRIENLDCPNCAKKVEKYLNKDKNISNAIIDFTKQTLTLDIIIKNNTKEYINKRINEIEPEVVIYEINNQTKTNKDLKKELLRLIIGTILGITGLFLENKVPILGNIFLISSYITLLYNIIIKAYKLLINNHSIDENTLITISCIGAFLLNEKMEGLMVIVLYQIGKVLENIAVNNSRKSISDLMNIKPEYANLKLNNKIEKVLPERVNVGDIIIVKKGEKIPLDGIIKKGKSLINTSALTGESKPIELKENDIILSGSINLGEVLEIETTSIYENSTVARILDLVENASKRKAKAENFVSSVAKVYTPIVIVLATIVIITFPLLFNYTLEKAVYIGLSYLVISCPCAIAISVPLSYFSGIGLASKKGILIKGSDYLDNIRKIKTIIFDKTGTITTGNFTDIDLNIINKKYKKSDIIKYYCLGESLSNHPIAKSIVNYYDKKIDTRDIKDYKEIPGKGIEYKIDDLRIKIGNSKLLNLKNDNDGIYLIINEEEIARINFADKIKENSKDTINELKKYGIKSKMFTGDKKETAEEIAKKCDIDEVKYELLPEDKYNLLLKELENTDSKTAFIGDGINDAPSIMASDIGLSMGNIGSASAIEASDIVIVNDDISKIVEAIKISNFTTKIIKENLIFSIGIKILILILTTMEITNMAAAVFADTGVTVIAILNTTRILKYKK